jgi:energy-coupling factor transport system permease protein
MRTAVGPTLAAERGRSWLHRLDPVVKLAWLVAIVVVVFATYNPVPLYTIAVVAFIVATSAGVAGRVARILLVFAPVAASILVIQTIAPAGCLGACDVVARLGPLELYEDGMIHGLTLIGRLLAVEVVALAVVTTTHASDLFGALARLRVPYVANLMLSMTLQLIPILQREFEIVLAAQRARAMRAGGFGAVLPSFVPVFAGAFERVQQLTIGLESRGFGSARRPTSFRRIEAGWRSAVGALAAVAAGVIGTAVAVTAWNAERMPDVLLPAPVVVALFVAAGTLFVALILSGIRSLARA